jgi:hypothetical protein
MVEEHPMERRLGTDYQPDDLVGRRVYWFEDDRRYYQLGARSAIVVRVMTPDEIPLRPGQVPRVIARLEQACGPVLPAGEEMEARLSHFWVDDSEARVQ